MILTEDKNSRVSGKQALVILLIQTGKITTWASWKRLVPTKCAIIAKATFKAERSRQFDIIQAKEATFLSLDGCSERASELQFFASYLTNRQQYVQMGNKVSSEQAMRCGIPQGSSLVPVLFLICINDLPNCSNALTFRIFADDTNVFASARDLRVLEKIVNSELKKWKYGVM